MALNAFPMARPCLLRENGAIEDFDGGSVQLTAGRPLVLSRAFCRFEHYLPPAGLSRSDQARAARIHAETAAPFEESGAVLVRQPGGIAIWYWDKTAVAAAAPAFDLQRGAAAPESLYRDTGDGWRIVACLEGFEAQYHEGSALRASTWRRQTFTRAQWNTFAFAVDDAAIAAPREPPEPIYTPLRPDGRWRRNQIAEPLTWRDAERALLAVAACGVLLTAIFAGQGAHALADAAADKDRAQTIGQTDTPAIAALQARVKALQAFNAVTPAHDVTATAVDAMEVFDLLNVSVREWRIDQRRFEARIEDSGDGGSLASVIAALEGSDTLANVTMKFSEAREAGTLDVSADVVGEETTR